MRLERVWLNRAIAGSSVGMGIAAGTTHVREYDVYLAWPHILGDGL